MIKLVVFDIAGTTIQDDNIVATSFNQAFADFGIFPTKQQIVDVMGLAKPIAIELILKDFGSLVDGSEIHDRFVKLMIDFYSKKENVKEIPGAKDVFSKLKDNDILVGLDTGFGSNITTVILEQTQWLNNHLVDAVVNSDQVSKGRPYPYMIFQLMETLDVERTKNVVKVGDTVSDLLEGENAGCAQVIGVTSGTCSADQLQKCQGTFFIVPDITHVPKLIGLE